MTSSGLDVVDRAVQETNRFLNIIMAELGTDDRRLAFAALRATLHALRDRLETHTATHLGAQLPLLLRGLYYEGWHLSRESTHENLERDFLDRVATELPPVLQDSPRESCMAALAAVSERLDGGEIARVVAQLPSSLRDLWPGEFTSESEEPT